MYVPQIFIDNNIQVHEVTDMAARRYSISFYYQVGDKQEMLAEWDLYPNKHFLRHFRKDLDSLKPKKAKKEMKLKNAS
jgi:hypothetical protein